MYVVFSTHNFKTDWSMSLARGTRFCCRGMKIYTRTGDQGTSQLYSGERRPKDDDVFMALGDTDELNAALGIVREYMANTSPLTSQIETIQSRLFDIGAAIATPRISSTKVASERKLNKTQFADENVTTLERWIDAMETELTPLKTFILPSGGVAATHLHLARAVCRRAERRISPLAINGSVESQVYKYMNRLSDYLFVAARFSAMKEGREETPWSK